MKILVIVFLSLASLLALATLVYVVTDMVREHKAKSRD